MSILGAFSVSTLAMQGQATALHQIGTNVSNVQTGGYKRADVQFQSVLGNQMFGELDQGGARPIINQRIDSQGLLFGTSSTLDLAISGGGFFITSTDFAASDIVYTRDGSFKQAAVNTISVTDPISGQSYTTKDGYLADKNGHFLLGFPANADGTFPTTGTPAPMRVDKNAFAAAGLPTTSADLIVNLDSNAAIVPDHLTAVSNLDTGGTKAEGMEILTVDFVDSNGARQEARLNFTKAAINAWDVSATYQGAGTAQVDTVALGGTVEVGDIYSVKVGNTTISYTALSTDTLTSVAANLVTAINADSQVSTEVVATAGTTAGTILLTAATAGTAFTSTTSATNGTGTAQVDTLTVSGALETGDVYEVIVGGVTASYTVTGGEGSLPGVVNGIIAKINSTTTVNSAVLASIGTNAGEIILTARTSGTPFTATARALDASSTAQVDTVTIGSTSSTFEIGDIYSVVVNGTSVPYTVTGGEGGLAGIRTALRAAINLDTTIAGAVTASDGGGAGEIVLTAQVPGTPFTTTATATDGGGTNDNTATVAPTTPNAVGATTNTATIANATPNVTAANDNTATVSTTTANNTGLTTSTVTRVPFLGDGRAGTLTAGVIVPPADISFSFTFPAVGTAAAGTADFTLDISGITQFNNSFQLQVYSEDGQENALIQEVGFDNQGHVVGFFSNGTSLSLFQVPLAKFPNPNALETQSGMVFRETETSGTPTIQTIAASGIAVFVPGAIEVSNVNLVDEFTAIIRAQQAYNSSAKALSAANEMLETIIQAKR